MMSEHSNTYFTCGVKNCNHVQPIDRPEDIRRFQICKDHMVDHYKWDHADMIGTRVNTAPPGVAGGDRYQYRPIPDNIGPTLTADGITNTWAEVKSYFN